MRSCIGTFQFDAVYCGFPLNVCVGATCGRPLIPTSLNQLLIPTLSQSYLGFSRSHTNHKHQTKQKQSQTLKRTKQSGRSSPPLEGLQGFKRGSAPLSLPQERNPHRRSSAQGEFENSPADCFQRGACPAIEGCPLLAYRTLSPARACPLRPHRSGVLGRTARFATLDKLAVCCRVFSFVLGRNKVPAFTETYR